MIKCVKLNTFLLQFVDGLQGMIFCVIFIQWVNNFSIFNSLFLLVIVKQNIYIVRNTDEVFCMVSDEQEELMSFMT